MKRKVLKAAALGAVLTRCRRAGKRIVFTNGCFDILHAGHVRYLCAARRLGDLLVVALNADASVRRLKGPNRPVNAQKDRAQVLAALECVDFVTVFSEDTPLRLIRALRPDVLVKGADWKKKDVVGASAVEARGGRVCLIPFLKGRSTSGLLEKIRRL